VLMELVQRHFRAGNRFPGTVFCRISFHGSVLSLLYTGGDTKVTRRQGGGERLGFVTAVEDDSDEWNHS